MAMIRQSEAAQLAQNGIPLDLGDLASRGELLRAEAQRAAENIVAQAQAERKRLLSDASEVGRQQGHAEGFAKGQEEGNQAGRAEALEQWTQRFDDLATKWEAALQELAEQRKNSLREAERGLIELGVAFAQRVARRAIELDPSPAASQVRAALERATAGSVVTIRVHPDDLEAVRSAMPTVIDALADSDAAAVTPDANITLGSCELDLVGGGSITYDTDEQLDRLVQTLLGESNETKESAA